MPLHNRSSRHAGTQRLMQALLEGPYVVATVTGASTMRGRKALDELLSQLDEEFILTHTEAVTALAQRYCDELQKRRAWHHPWPRLHGLLVEVASRDDDEARAAAVSFIGEWRRILREDAQTEQEK